jgi:hypothetical protein
MICTDHTTKQKKAVSCSLAAVWAYSLCLCKFQTSPRDVALGVQQQQHTHTLAEGVARVSMVRETAHNSFTTSLVRFAYYCCWWYVRSIISATTNASAGTCQLVQTPVVSA